MEFTRDQAEAIRARGCNLLVTAAAGSGKTAVLVERIIKMITEDKIDIDSLLVMTFTKAAAAEMRERVHKAISKRLNETPGDTHLRRQIALLPKASITTIHSFCGDLVRNYFYVADIDPAFRVADDTEARLLKNEAAYEAIDEMFEGEQSRTFDEFYEGYGEYKEENVKKIILKFYDFAMSTPFPERWITAKLEELKNETKQTLDETVWGEILKLDVRMTLEGCIAKLKDAIFAAGQNEGTAGYIKQLSEEKQMIYDVVDSNLSWGELQNRVTGIKFGTLKGAEKGADEYARNSVKKCRDKAKESIRKLIAELFSRTEQEHLAAISYTVPLMECLCQTVLKMNEKFREKKKDKMLLDFNDLEHYAIEILTKTDDCGNVYPSDVALNLRDKYTEILVDEYQDSNEVQEVIFNSLSNGDNLFAVGDIKQSIYSFRHTNPMLFKHKKDTYKTGEGEINRKISLSLNFRSNKNILNAINYIFSKIMSETTGEIDYNSEEYLYGGANCDTVQNHDVELHLVENRVQKPEIQETDEQEGEEQEERITLSGAEHEANVVAKRIVSMIAEGYQVFDKTLGEMRKVTYKDMVVLMRSVKGNGEVFAKVMADYGIPVYLDAGDKYFETVEINTVISLLKVIDNPYQDIPLLAVLRSPLFGFVPSELVEIRLCNKEADFFEALNLRGNMQDGLGRKIRRFFALLSGWRRMSEYAGVDVLIDDIYSKTGYYNFCGVMAGGELRQSNLNLLAERAKQFEQTSFKGLFRFITFVEKMQSGNSDFGAAKTLSEHQDVVRIMSIHKSKGLEFPVVFVSRLGKKFNKTDLRDKIMFHDKWGIAPDFVDVKTRITYSTIAKYALKIKKEHELLAEEMRILYVALTRARDKLILTGDTQNIDKTLMDWCGTALEGRLSDYSVFSAKSYLDLVGRAVISHKDFKGVSPFEYHETVQEDCLCNWKVYTVYAKQAAQTEETEKLIEMPSWGGYVDPYVKQQLEYEYPYAAASKMPVKITVTELKRGQIGEEESSGANLYMPHLREIPDFMQKNQEISGAEKGILVHYIMQHLDFSEDMNYNNIRDEIRRMTELGAFSETDVSEDIAEKILRFFQSNIGISMQKHKDTLQREVPFLLNLPAKEVYKEQEEGLLENESILLQGVIDCYFVTEEGVVVLDYKTDRIRNDITELKDKYSVQLEYYAKAIEKISGETVAKKVIYSFEEDKELYI